MGLLRTVGLLAAMGALVYILVMLIPFPKFIELFLIASVGSWGLWIAERRGWIAPRKRREHEPLEPRRPPRND